MAGTPKTQEHFSAGAWQPTVPKNEALGISDTCRKCRSGGAWQSTIPKNEADAKNAEAVVGD
jgi:hypothetical protein